MKERNRHMLCCGCGYAVKENTMFKKIYRNTALCLCKRCTKKLYAEMGEKIKDWSDEE